MGPAMGLNGSDSGGDGADSREHSELRERTTHGRHSGAQGDVRPNPGGGPRGQPARQRVGGQRGDGAAQCLSAPVDKLANRRFGDAQRRRELGATQPLKRTTQQGLTLPAR